MASELPGRLEGAVCIVTGGGAGIGAGIVLRFAREGATLVVADLDGAAGAEAADAARAVGADAMSIPTDVTDAVSRDDLVARALDAHGRIDVLVNNAGVTSPAGLFDVDEAGWDRVMAVNATGTFFCLQAVAREMARAGTGAIVNMASIAAKASPGVNNIAYAAAKAAVVTMTRVAAATLAPYGVRVNAVCPGSTDTPLLRDVVARQAAATGEREDDVWRSRVERIPLGRVNTVDDIASVTAFLASRDSATMTGQSLNVCGGRVWD